MVIVLLLDLRHRHDLNLLTRTVNDEQRTYTYGHLLEPSTPVTPTLPQRIYLPLVARDHDPSVSGVVQPFAVVAVSHGFQAAYDRNGNMTLCGVVSGTETFTHSQVWNAENRLISVSGATSASFVYDGDGNRVKSVLNGVTTYYVGNYFEWRSTTSNMTRYYYAGSQRVAMRQGGVLMVLHGDHGHAQHGLQRQPRHQR